MIRFKFNFHFAECVTTYYLVVMCMQICCIRRYNKSACHSVILQRIYHCVKVKIAQSCPTLCDPMDCTVYGILQARILQWVAFPSSKGSSHPRSPILQADSLPAEPQGKPKNTGAGSLSLLQWILTQESYQGILCCRQILYQLSYEGSPNWSGLPCPFQGIFPIQELNLGLLHCRRIVYHLSHEESPRILEWVVYPFSRRSSQPRNQTRVSCVAGGFFTS